MAPRITETLPLVTALLLIAAISRGQTEDVIRPTGSDVTLSPNYRGDFKDITWLLNNNRLVELELELNEKQQPVWYKSYPQLKVGASLNNQTGELTIPQLTIRDSGKYRADVKLHDLTYHYTDITLTVLDPVVTPIITNQTTEDWIFLICESTTPGVNYRWQNNEGNIVFNDKTYTIHKPIKLLNLTCTASNAVSEGRASVTIEPPSVPIVPSGGHLSVGNISWITVIMLVLTFVLIPTSVICFEIIRGKFRNNPRVKAINKRCNPFPYCFTDEENSGKNDAIPTTAGDQVNAGHKEQQELLPKNIGKDWKRHNRQCTHTPCCIKNEVNAWINGARPKTAEDLLRHSSQCTHNPCCIRDEVIAWINGARPNKVEDRRRRCSICTHNPRCIRAEEKAEDNDARPKAGEDNLKPDNEGNGTPEQQEILLENMGKVKGNKTGSREEV